MNEITTENFFHDIYDIEWDLYELIDYLGNTTDWKQGKKPDGSDIMRLQKWYHYNGSFFSKNWRKRPERWKSCIYDPFLLDFQN